MPTVGRLWTPFGSPERQEQGGRSKEKKKDETFCGRHNSLEKEVDPVLECGQVNEKHSKEKETKVRR